MRDRSKNAVRAVAILASLLACGENASAQSTINPANPAQGAPLASSPIRANFGAATNDVNGILGMHAVASLGLCAVTTIAGIDCLVTGATPALWYKSTGLGTYSLVATWNLSTSTFIPTGTSGFTANLPLIGSASGTIGQGTRSGTTTKYATVNGSITSGHCTQADANGNIADAGGPCTTGGALATNIQVFPVNGTWTKLAFAVSVDIQEIGGGAGGGGGACGAQTVSAVPWYTQGGGGGAAGGYVAIYDFPAAGLPSSAAVTVGTGGAGGLGATVGCSGIASPGPSASGPGNPSRFIDFFAGGGNLGSGGPIFDNGATTCGTLNQAVGGIGQYQGGNGGTSAMGNPGCNGQAPESSGNYTSGGGAGAGQQPSPYGQFNGGSGGSIGWLIGGQFNGGVAGATTAASTPAFINTSGTPSPLVASFPVFYGNGGGGGFAAGDGTAGNGSGCTSLNSSFNGQIAANILTVNSLTTGTVAPWQQINGAGISPTAEFITSQLSGTTGGVGTYQVSQSATISAEAMTGTGSGFGGGGGGGGAAGLGNPGGNGGPGCNGIVVITTHF